jgi:hypothetical protein
MVFDRISGGGRPRATPSFPDDVIAALRYASRRRDHPIVAV